MVQQVRSPEITLPVIVKILHRVVLQRTVGGKLVHLALGTKEPV